MSSNTLAGRHFLIVEDQMMLLRLMEGTLEDLGCTSIQGAATVDRALEMIAANVFDGATLDVNLNGVMSYPIADELTARGVPFMFVTGYGDSALPVAYAGRAILRKPFMNWQAVAAFEDMVPRMQTVIVSY